MGIDLKIQRWIRRSSNHGVKYLTSLPINKCPHCEKLDYRKQKRQVRELSKKRLIRKNKYKVIGWKELWVCSNCKYETEETFHNGVSGDVWIDDG